MEVMGKYKSLILCLNEGGAVDKVKRLLDFEKDLLSWARLRF